MKKADFELRPFERKDREAWLRYEIERTANRNITKTDFDKALASEKRQANRDTRWEWKIFEKSTGDIVGFIDIKTVNRDPYQVCDVGYFVIPSRRGEGWATKAAQAAIPKIFRTLKFHRLEFAIEKQNKASLKIARRLNLHNEGTRKHYWPTSYPKPSKVWSDQQIFVATPELRPPRPAKPQLP